MDVLVKFKVNYLSIYKSTMWERQVLLKPDDKNFSIGKDERCSEAETLPSRGGPAAQTPRRATPNHPPLGALGCVQPSCCPRAREGLGCGGSTEHTDPPGRLGFIEITL